MEGAAPTGGDARSATSNPPDRIEAPEGPHQPAGALLPLLAQLQRIDGAPYVHPKPISFKNGAARANWNSFEPADCPNRDVLSNFVRAAHPGPTWLGYMDVPTVNWVQNNRIQHDGHKAWEDDAWHSYAVAVISNPPGQPGKHVVVYDCDPPPALRAPDPRLRDILRAPVRNLLQELQNSTHGSRPTVWYNTDETHAGQDRCRELSFARLREWAEMGDSHYQQGDERMRDCRKITRP